MSLFRTLSLLSLSACLSASAQSYLAKKIIFKHPGAFTQAQLEAASGLHEDMKVTGEDVGAAAQKLADTQYFDNVVGAMDATTGGIIVSFDLTPSPAAKFLPVGFENILWLTPAEIDAAIRTRVPLYNGTLAEGSAPVDDASAALKDALAAKGIPAKVACESVEPSLLHPLRVLEFRVSSPAVRVADVKLSGVATSLVPLLQASVNKTVRTAYNAGLNGLLTADRILAPIEDAGYVKAQLTDETADAGAVGNNVVPVTVHATLNAGDAYHVGAIAFAGTPLYSAEAFAKNAKLKAGDVANMSQLLTTLAPLNDAYLNKGFLDVLVNTDPAFDEAAKTVSYNVTVVPGDPYMLHDLTFVGLDDPAAQAQFRGRFALKIGDAYSPVYLRDWMKQDRLPGQIYPLAFKATAYPVTHTVDLVLSFANSTIINAR